MRSTQHLLRMRCLQKFGGLRAPVAAQAIFTLGDYRNLTLKLYCWRGVWNTFACEGARVLVFTLSRVSNSRFGVTAQRRPKRDMRVSRGAPAEPPVGFAWPIVG